MHFHWESFVFAVIAFAILYWLLSKYAFGPLFDVMEKRRQKVMSDLNQAEEQRKQSTQLIEEQKQALQQAKTEAYEIIERAKVASVRQADELLGKAKDEAARLKEEAAKEIENEKNKAVAELHAHVGELAVQIASKIIEKQVDEAAHKDMINSYLRKVGN
ncbi:F0F1 ATP synthase subunit B [Paenibacillus turpanensis]|uniref:F0F1 ATP synthase subunit B n=1 Tax=Paenibacillus turpanensis TaxID=2689078 RepID=UPI00140A9CCE|nr:F0F1 ATP synthase subunit B [Paenibacillus turpanensis]